MKSNPEMRIFLISMIANIIITYLMGFRYKDMLINNLSSPVYYQLLVFISLCLPLIIKLCDRKARLYLLDYKIKRLKDHVNPEMRESLDEETLAKLETLTKGDLKTTEMIKEMHEALEELKK